MAQEQHTIALSEREAEVIHAALRCYWQDRTERGQTPHADAAALLMDRFSDLLSGPDDWDDSPSRGDREDFHADG